MPRLTRQAVESQHRSSFGRSPVLSRHGMVATSHPLAAGIGLDVLKGGGNAIDAAVATNAALGLMEPMSCGIGGDLFAIVWEAKTQKLHGLNASGRAPALATIDWFKSRGMDYIPSKGELSWSVPGCVDGWDMLVKRFGKLSLKQLLEPTIHAAEEGIPVTPVIAGYWKAAEGLKSDAGMAATYLPGGHSPRTGDLFRNPQLAQCYKDIAMHGRDSFYKGRISHSVDKFSKAVGGLLRGSDLAEHTSQWVDPVSTDYRGTTVWELPPPGQGIAALQILNLLEPYDLKSLGHGSPEYWHLFLEAKKLAYADRARFYADPEFVKMPVAELISKAYADARRKQINSAKAATKVDHGDPKIGKADTVYLCAVDGEGNCCSLIQSNYNGFGSGMAAPDLGFALQNRGTLFALDPDHPNRLEPRKRPFHTIIPAMATRDGKPWLTFGMMGGDMQAQGHAQALINMIDFGMDVQQAGEALRMEHTGSATPTGVAMQRGGGTVEAEEGFSPSLLDDLKSKGHVVKTVAKNGGGYQAIMIDPATGVLHGGSEPRKDGCAMGW